MSEMAKTAREAMKAKAQRMADGDPRAKVDCSDWSPPEQLETTSQTGERPISKRQFKRGGKVEGEHAQQRADRKARASGGKALTANSYVNRDVREANEERAGTKHVGGFKAGGSVSDGTLEGTRPTGGRLAKKHGGRADAHWIKEAVGDKGALHRSLHVPEGDKIPERKLEKAAHSSNKLVAKRAHLAETLKGLNHEGRSEHKSGGRAGKGKMNVNIVIATGKPDDTGPQASGPPMAPPIVPPIVPPHPMPMAPPPAMAGPPPGGPPMGGGMPPGMMPRKAGGRTNKVAHEMAEYGGAGGGGLGRLEKIKAYGGEAFEGEGRNA